MAIKLYSLGETTQMALHYDPIRIKRLTISSSCTEDDIILFWDLHLIALHISFSLASLSLILPWDPVRSMRRAAAHWSPLSVSGQWIQPHSALSVCLESTRAVTGRFSLLSRNIRPLLGEQWQAIFVDPAGSPPRRWKDVRYLDNMWHTIWDPDIQDVQRRCFIWPMSDGFAQKLKRWVTVCESVRSVKAMLSLNKYS